MGLGISGSTVKSWFQYRCERKTRYEMMDAADRAAVPVVEDEREKPWADFGIDYEKRVLSRLAGRTRVLLPAVGEEGLSERQAAAFLRGAKGAEYAAQVNLRPDRRPAFLADLPNVKLRRTYADLVRYDGAGPVPLFRVIDIKATRRATAFHKAQVAFYARMLQAMLAELRAPGQVDPTASIWHIPENGQAQGDAWHEDDFALAPYLRLIDEFFSRTLPEIARKKVAKGVDDTFFHVYFKCEQCAYLPHCRRYVDDSLPPGQRDISATPGLSQEAKRTLDRAGVHSVARLAAAAGLRQMDGAGWSLSRSAETLVSRAAALRDGQVRRAPEPHSFLMPPRVDVGFFLLADHDPVDDNLVTLGYLKVEDGRTTETIEVLPSSDRGAEADALVRVFTLLLADLQRVDRLNLESDAGLYSHIFFYEPAEAISLQNAVKRHLNDPRVREGLLHLVRLFPPDEVVPEPEYRGMHHLPATAVRSVVEQLYSLPVTVAYDLRQVSMALAASGMIADAYRPSPAFQRDFSSLLSIEVSRGLRERRRGHQSVEAVKADVRARLRATRAIADWLRAEHDRALEAGEPPMLRLAKRPFRLHGSFDPLQPGDLDVLRAFELLENRAGLLDTLIRLAQPVHTRRDTQRCIADMRLRQRRRLGRNYLLLFDVPRESREAELGPDDPGLILSDDDPDLRLDPRRWSELGCRIMPPRDVNRPGHLGVLVSAPVFEGAVFQTLIRRAGERGWCIDQAFFDVNTPKAAAFLSYLADGDGRVGA